MDRLKRGVDFRNGAGRILRGPPEKRKNPWEPGFPVIVFSFVPASFEAGIGRDAAGLEHVPPLIDVIGYIEIADAFFHRGFVESLSCFISGGPTSRPQPLASRICFCMKSAPSFGVSPCDGMRAHDDIGGAWEFLVEGRGGAMPAGFRKQVLINALDSRKTRQVDPVVLDRGGVAVTEIRVAVGKAVERRNLSGAWQAPVRSFLTDLLIAAGDPAREQQIRKKRLVAVVGRPLPFGARQQVGLQRVVCVAVIVGRAGARGRAPEVVRKFRSGFARRAVDEICCSRSGALRDTYCRPHTAPSRAWWGGR